MSFTPNKLGLYDLSGNVAEWCEDWYSGEKAARVIRGGSWFSSQRIEMLSSSRNFRDPSSNLNYIGFRIVLETTD